MSKKKAEYEKISLNLMVMDETWGDMIPEEKTSLHMAVSAMYAHRLKLRGSLLFL